jgi:predicted ferric reductase
MTEMGGVVSRKTSHRRAILSQVAREWIVTAALVAGAGAVLVMWALDKLPSRSSIGDWTTSAGRVTGLEGTYFVLVAVLLLARVWWLERMIGMDRLATWHRRVGQLAIWLLVAHAVLIVWGYASSFHASFAGETKTVILDLPDMLAATVGLLVLVGVSVTAFRFVRGRLSYQVWYFVHLYVYVAIALSFAHQFATGADFATHPVNRMIWVLLYVFVFGLLLWYRVFVPLRSQFRHRLKVARVVTEAKNSVSVHISGKRLAELRAESGQFFIWRFLTREGWWQAHPFSLSAPPGHRALRLTIRASGDFTQNIASLRVGTKVIAEGPFGGFTARQATHRKVLFVAAGAGISPIRALFETIPAVAGGLTLLYRASEETQLALCSELEDVAAKRGGTVMYLVGNRDQHGNLFDPTWLRTILDPTPKEYDAYVCGPPGFMERMRLALRVAGVARRHIHSERFELSG